MIIDQFPIEVISDGDVRSSWLIGADPFPECAPEVAEQTLAYSGDPDLECDFRCLSKSVRAVAAATLDLSTVALAVGSSSSAESIKSIKWIASAR